MSSNIKPYVSRSNLIKWVISVILAAIFIIIPIGDVYTNEIKWFFVVTVFGLALSAFELVSVGVIGILMPGAWLLFKVAPANIALQVWGSSTAVLIFGALFIGVSLERCGLLQRISFLLMSKVRGGYFMLLFMIMLVCVILNIITNGQAYVVTGALFMGMFISLGRENRNLGVGICMATLLGSCTAHSYTYQATAWSILMSAAGQYPGAELITPASVMLHNWPMFFVSLIILFIVSKWYKPEEYNANNEYFKLKLQKLGKMSYRERSNCIVMMILLVLIFTTGITHISIDVILGLTPLLLFLPGVNGADEKVLRQFPFEMFFFILSCGSIGSVATYLGLGDILFEYFGDLLGGDISIFKLLLLIIGIVFVLNFFMTPMAIFPLVAGPLCALAVDAGMSAQPFLYAINACSEAILLPYEYVPYLIIFSFGMMSTVDFLKTNILRSVIFFAGILFIMLPYWQILGLFELS